MEADRNIVTTAFGTVSDRRVRYQSKKSWFRGGIAEDIPLRHVTSVTLQTSRHPIWAIVFAFLGLACLVSGDVAGFIFGVLFGVLVVLFMWGSPAVHLNLTGGGPRVSTGFPWTRPAAEQFVNALRGQLFRDEEAREARESTPRWG
jgi:hypothetical protein